MKHVFLSNRLFLIMNMSDKIQSLTCWLNTHDVIAQIYYVRPFKTEEDRKPVMLNHLKRRKNNAFPCIW